MKKYIYHVETWVGDEIDDSMEIDMTLLGGKGWKLVSTVQRLIKDQTAITAFFETYFEDYE